MGPAVRPGRVFEGPASRIACRVLGAVSEWHTPDLLLRRLVASYVAWFRVDMSQVLVPVRGFRSFADFFARELQPEARPACSDPDAVVCPCDGVLVERGRIGEGTADALKVKGTMYRLPELIGDAAIAAGLAGGGYCLLYLHPRDYHRVHAPLDARLCTVRHIPGARYPMAPWASGFAGDALGKNERVAFDLELSMEGRCCVLLMVAAFGVGNIECRQVPGAVGRGHAVRRTPCAVLLRRGDPLGAFRLGSTVVLLWPENTLELEALPEVGGRVLAGQRLGRVQELDRHARARPDDES